MKKLLNAALIGWVSLLVGCDSLEVNYLHYDPYKEDPKECKSLDGYYSSIPSHGIGSFEQLRTKIHNRVYYVYNKDTDNGDLIINPAYVSGYSIKDLERHGNRIYAISKRSCAVDLTLEMQIEFWIIAERDGKVFVMGPSVAYLPDFNSHFKRIKDTTNH